MALSRRLETIAGLVPPGTTAADIGTDHGLIPAALAGRGICPHVIATDLRPGPLKAARSLIRTRGLEDRVSLRLGDGLAPVRPGEADVIIVSGMGGALMRRILENGRETAAAASCLILSPQSELEAFRSFLWQESYFIDEERILEEDGKYYFILRVHPGEAQTLSREELCFGKNVSSADLETYSNYLLRETAKAERLRERLQGLSGEEVRREELTARLDLLAAIRKTLGSPDGSGKRETT